MSRPVNARHSQEADRLLDAEEVRDGLALEEADLEVLRAISRGENVARADLALSALRLRLEWSQQKPTPTISHLATFHLLDPYAEPPEELPTIEGSFKVLPNPTED